MLPGEERGQAATSVNGEPEINAPRDVALDTLRVMTVSDGRVSRPGTHDPRPADRSPSTEAVDCA
ncbi:hypothetical protein GCM10027598_00310 [Amycolatopsis oliviviridis]|uniref:Uncharacterized protein n=1 Tax=Amycolatopsis oliviviridis TaxID=1471590 RepID=A0ABQ3LSN1_9PSEU|nr:hypothetical protein GCM10017790_45560 [Amycolatopsis oliviviridis]